MATPDAGARPPEAGGDPRRIGIELVNHACVVLHCGTTRILCDPWLEGSVFNDGWDLMVETGRTLAEIDFDHVWLSHEHPDHFSPKALSAIPGDRRPGVTVLIQETLDRKVAAFCKRLGFPVQELRDHEAYRLGEDVQLTCARVRGFDSWLLVEAFGQRVLNLNDGKPDQRELASIREACRGLDVLMTQFAYASWVGNEPELQQVAAERHLAYVDEQIDALRPGFVIPFASFAWFSHRESHHLNACNNRVDQAARRITARGSRPVVMFPGDGWCVGDPVDDRPALARWERVYRSLPERPQRTSVPVSLPEILDAFAEYVARIRAKNDWEEILRVKRQGYLPPASIYLWDHARSLTLDLVEGLHESDVPEAQCDVAMHSQSLHYLLRFEWGRGSLMIGGRVRVSYETVWRFLRQTQIAYANNIGQRFPAELTLQALIEPSSVMGELIEYRNRLQGASRGSGPGPSRGA
jgi:Beta-lactamase superfamily domain